MSILTLIIIFYAIPFIIMWLWIRADSKKRGAIITMNEVIWTICPLLNILGLVLATHELIIKESSFPYLFFGVKKKK